jgi:polar amino acid transport system substrate-binding protein
MVAHIAGRNMGLIARIGLAVALLLAGWSAGGAELQLLTEEYPPLSFTKDGKVGGLSVEIVDEIQRRVGSKVAIQVLPWARAYRMAQEQPDVALFGTTRTAERDKLFQWVGPIVAGRTSLYAKRGTGLRLNSLAELGAGDAVIVPREDYKHQLLKAAGVTNLQTVNTHEQMVRMVLYGRGTLMAANSLTLPTLLANVGASPQDLELVYTFHQAEAYVAFSLGTPPEVVREWQAALNAMKRDKTFARIYAKWLPDETPPEAVPAQ